MKRPSEKLLREMSYKELSIESEWHLAEASIFLEKAEELRADSLGMNEKAADEILQLAVSMDAEAEAHVHQSNLLNSLMYSRLAEQPVEKAHGAAKG